MNNDSQSKATKGTRSPVLTICIESLPPAEHEQAIFIQKCFLDLSGALDQFAHAVSLFEHCQEIGTPLSKTKKGRVDMDELNKLNAWQHMAARYGAISISEFYKISQAISTSVKLCPSLEQKVGSRKKFSQIFKDSFPDFAYLRDFAAHGMEMTGSLQKVATHSAKVGNNSILMNSTLLGNKYVCTHKGCILSYTIDRESVANLREARDAFFEAFVPLQRQ